MYKKCLETMQKALDIPPSERLDKLSHIRCTYSRTYTLTGGSLFPLNLYFYL